MAITEGLSEYSPAIIITVVIATGAVYAITRAVLDRKDPESRRAVAQENTIGQTTVPMWAMMGPVHDVIQAIHDIAEEERKQSGILQAINNIAEEERKQTGLLKELTDILRDTDRGQTLTHKLLESILNNQELRPDFAEPAHPNKRRDRD